jgi:hypothetical protein
MSVDVIAARDQQLALTERPLPSQKRMAPASTPETTALAAGPCRAQRLCELGRDGPGRMMRRR